MDTREAELLLADADVVPVLEASLDHAKEMAEVCLAADVPALLHRDECCGKGCTPKLQLLVREEDVPRVAALFQARWRELAEREGTLPPAGERTAVAGAATDDDVPPCPACGVAAEPVDGACVECGLVLE